MNLYLYVALLLIELVFLIGLASYSIGLLYSSLMGAPYVPTSNKQIQTILETAKLKKNQVFLELGSGDGRIVRQAVKKYGVRGIGVDINQLLVFLSRFYAKREKLSAIEFRRENIFNTDLKSADTVYMFLMPDLLKKLLPRFGSELKPKTLVISHGFKLEGWEKKKVAQIDSEPFATFFYRK